MNQSVNSLFSMVPSPAHRAWYERRVSTSGGLAPLAVRVELLHRRVERSLVERDAVPREHARELRPTDCPGAVGVGGEEDLR